LYDEGSCLCSFLSTFPFPVIIVPRNSVPLLKRGCAQQHCLQKFVNMHSGLSALKYNHSLFAATYCSQPGQHFRGLLGHFTLDMIQKIDCLFPSQVEHYPWTALIDPPWAETIQHVDAAWCAGDACQDMDPSAASRPHFTPVVTPDKTPNPRAEQECHRYASRNAPSPSLSTLCPSVTQVPRRTRRPHHAYILVDVSQHYSIVSLSFTRAFGKGVSRLLLEHISLQVDSQLSLSCLCSLAWCYLIGWGFWFATRPLLPR